MAVTIRKNEKTILIALLENHADNVSLENWPVEMDELLERLYNDY